MGGIPLGWQPLSDTGAIQVSGTLTFSITGTTTAKNVYSDKGLTSALSNPLTLDAAGRISTNVFLLKDQGYRVVLKNSAGTTIWTRDEVFADGLAVDEETRRKEIIRSPFDHAAVGDGSTNDAVALAAALAAADGVLDLEGKTYRCDSTLALRSGIKIQNGTLDFSNAAIAAGLKATGTVGTPSVVSSATTGGQSITPASTTGFVAGDLIILYSTDTVASGHNYAEIFRIEQISGANIIVDGVILGTYATSANVAEITPISDAVLENLTIIQPSAGPGVTLHYAQRAKVLNCTFKGPSTADFALWIGDSYDILVDGCSVIPGASAEQYGGVSVSNASRDVLISNCHIERSLYAVEIGQDYAGLVYDGITRNVRVIDCAMMWCGQINILEGARYVDIDGNTMECDIAPSSVSIAAILVGGADVTVRDNTIRNPEGVGVTVTALSSCDSIEISRNKISNGETHGIHVTDTAFTVQSMRIVDNEIHECAGSEVLLDGTIVVTLAVNGNICRGGTGTAHAIDLTSADNITTVICSNNQVECASTRGSAILVSVAGPAYARATIDNNQIQMLGAGTQTGISTTSSALGYLTISHNTIAGDGATNNGPAIGVNVSGVTLGTVIDHNTIELARGGAATACIIAAGDSVSIDANVLISNGQTGKGIDYAGNNASRVSITGNNIRTDDTGIEVSAVTNACSYLTIAGNNVLVTTASATVYVCDVNTTSSGGAGFDNVTISGNTFARSGDDGPNTIISNVDGISATGNTIINGNYGLDIATSTGATQNGNSFVGVTTRINGAFNNPAGYINLDITTIKIISTDDLQATTEGMLPDTNTAPLIQRVATSTDKGHRVVWAAASVVEVDFAPFAYPPDLDDQQAVTVNILVSKNTNTDTTAVIAVSYFEGLTDTNAGGNTGALSTESITQYTVTIATGDVGAYPTMAKIGLTPGAHGTDQIRLHAAWIEYTKKTGTV